MWRTSLKLNDNRDAGSNGKNAQTKGEKYEQLVKKNSFYNKGLRQFPITEFPGIAIFGSARQHVGKRVLEFTKIFSASASKLGYVVITGGGPNIMELSLESAEKVVKERNASNTPIGVALRGLASKGEPTSSSGKIIMVDRFEERKDLMIYSSNAFLFLPGGFGTLDELFEVIGKMEKGDIPLSPVILANVDGFYSNLYYIMKDMVRQKTMRSDVFSHVYLVKTPRAALELIKNVSVSADIYPDEKMLMHDEDIKTIYSNVKNIRGNTVSMLGSSSLRGKHHPYLQLAFEMAKLFSKDGFTIFTGGYNGIPAEFIRAAATNGGPSYEFSLKHGGKPPTKLYEGHHIVQLNLSHSIKLALLETELYEGGANPKIFLPGGAGTHDLFCELKVRTATGFMPQSKTIVAPKGYWGPVIEWIKRCPLAEGYIDKEHFDNIFYASTPRQAMDFVKNW